MNSPYHVPIAEELPVQIQQYDSHHVPSIVTIQPPMPVMGKRPTLAPVHGLPLDQTDYQHPAKKAKTSTFFSKFLPTTLTRPGY